MREKKYLEAVYSSGKPEHILYNTDAVVKMLGFSNTSSVRAIANQHKLGYYQPGSNTTYFSVADIKVFEERRNKKGDHINPRKKK